VRRDDSNQYYYARLLRSQKPDEREAGERIGPWLPNQASWGAHVNIPAPAS
jgi:iron(III) transport system substrate-binding protein